MKMQFRFNNAPAVLSTLLVLLFVTQAYQAELMCYVCQDCTKIMKNTPLESCNEEYFQKDGTTLPSTLTTTELPTSSETSTKAMTTSSEKESSTNEATTTESITSEQSTPPTPPTPPTASPPHTDTPMPTPTKIGFVELATTEDASAGSRTPTIVVTTGTAVPLNGTNNTTVGLTGVFNNSELTVNDDITVLHLLDNTTSQLNPASSLAPTTNATITFGTTAEVGGNVRVGRQRRQAKGANDFTYHCYSVQKKVNNAMTMERGCSRVTAMQGVCQQLELTSNNTHLSKCRACTNSRCNGSATLGVSLLALLIGIVAATFNRK